MESLREREYGKTLIATRVDELARQAPDAIWASFPRSAEISKGFRNVTWADLANSVNRAAFWIESKLGPSVDFDTVVYLGRADVRYFILLLGAIKAGYKLLFTAPTNTLEGNLALLEETRCNKIFYSEGTSAASLIERSKTQRPYQVPGLDDLLDARKVPHFLYEKSYDTAQSEPYVVLHSSGTTGLPKPIVCPQALPCSIDAMHLVPPFGMDARRDVFTGMIGRCKKLFCALPFFHAGGINYGLLVPAYYDISVVFGSPDVPLSATFLDEVIDHGNIDSVAAPSSILEDMTTRSSSLERLSLLQLVLYVGAPLISFAGTLISQKTFLSTVFGATEYAGLAHYVGDPEDWQYLLINPEAQGIEMRAQVDKALFELVFVRKPHLDHVQGIFKTFPDLTEYGTKDLYEKHPRKPHLWRLVGRADDLVVLSNGKKFQPRPLEDLLSAHALVRAALVVGQGRPNPGAILELRSIPESSDQANAWLESIFETAVKQANDSSPSYARLEKSFVSFAPPDKPFIRVGKGSISRATTLKQYEPEIEQLYHQTEANGLSDCLAISPDMDAKTMDDMLKSLFERTTGIKLLSSDETFFSEGVDSLRIISFALSLRRAVQPPEIKSFCKNLDTRFIYENPTVSQLSRAILSLLNEESVEGRPQVPVAAEATQAIEQMVNKYTMGIRKSPEQGKPFAVLLTGGTGSLGSYLLHNLLQKTQVERIYCFNRASTSDPTGRQRNIHLRRGLSTSFEKVHFINANLSSAFLGLQDQSLYQDMIKCVGLIIHTQWPVNFNFPLAYFEPSVAGTARLAEFAASALCRPPLIFISSVGEAQRWRDPYPVPEEFINDPSLCTHGYGESKNAGTRILEHAASACGVQSSVIRIGQIAGPVAKGPEHGMWPKHEWLPALIAGAKHLGKLPDSLGSANRIDWVPVDRTADIVTELSFGRAERLNGSCPSVEYLHVVSPRVCTWQDVLPAIQDYFRARGQSMELVALESWTELLQASAADAKDSNGNPAVKLLDFYEALAEEARKGNGAPRFQTEKTERSSKVLASTGPVTCDMMKIWLEQWGY